MIDKIDTKDFFELPSTMLSNSKNVKYIQLLSEKAVNYYYYTDLKKELVVFKKFKVEQNLNFCNIPNLIKIYVLAHRKYYRINK